MADAASPGAFLTEVDEAKQPSPVNTPRKESVQHLQVVIETLKEQLSATRQDFATQLTAVHQFRQAAHEFAYLCHTKALEKDVIIQCLEEELERRRMAQRELNYRGHFALLATADRASIVNRALRRGLHARETQLQACQRDLEHANATIERERSAASTSATLAKHRIDALEDAHSAAQKLIEELRFELAELRRESPIPSEGSAAAQVDVPPSPTGPHVVHSLADANEALARRITEVRNEHNVLSALLQSETERADAATRALRAAEIEVESLRSQMANKTSEMPSSSVLADLNRLEALGGVTAVLATLSERTQLLAEVDDENRRLKEEIVLLEARCVTTETRLHHSVEEGVATSILLERGIGRLKAQRIAEPEGAETRKSLTQAALTLRRALEKEGYDVTSLPLAPDPSLDLPYLKQILNDHAELCAQHFQRGGAGHVVPSATRQPLVYTR